MAQTALTITLRLADRFTAALPRVEAATAAFGKKVEKAGKKVTTAVTVPLLAVGAASIKAGADFETGMTNVETLLDTNIENMNEMRAGVLGIGRDVAVPLGELTSALYDIRSAGIGADRALTDLEKSAQLGTAALGSTKQAANVATSAINAFGLEGERADAVYGQVFTAVKFGKTNLDELSQGFGSVAGIVASNNIRFEEFLATTAALTTTGLKASEAYTQQKAILAGLTRQTDDTRKVFKQMGVRDFPDLVREAGSYTEALAAVGERLGIFGVNNERARKALRKLGVGGFEDLVKRAGSAEEATKMLAEQIGRDDKTLLKALGSVEALNALLSLTGPQAQAATDALAAMENGNDALATAVAKQNKTMAARWQRTKNVMAEAAISISEVLAPALEVVAEKLQVAARWFSGLDDGTKKTLVTIASVAAVVGPSLIVVGKLSQGVRDVTGAVKFLNKTSRDFISKNPWGAAAIAAGIAVALIIEHWEPIKAFFVELWDDITEIFQRALDEIQPVIDAIKSAADLVGGGTFGQEIELRVGGKTLSELEAEVAAQDAARPPGPSLSDFMPGAMLGGGAGTNGAPGAGGAGGTVRVEFENLPAGARVRQTDGAPIDLSAGYQFTGAQ